MDEIAILKAIVREMQKGVLVLDKEGTILYANPFFTRNYSPHMDVKGSDIKGLRDRVPLLDAIACVLKRRNTRSTESLEIGHADRFFKIRTVELNDAGDSTLIVFIEDITEEKRVEAIKKDFVANVSHELRTPLASIKGYAETLLDGGFEDREKLKEFLRIIDKHATRMSRLIEDLLILSRLESQDVPMDSEPIDIYKLIASITEGFKKHAQDKGITLSIKKDGRVPDVLGDRVRLEQVMVNLLDNAIKYTPQGGKVDVAVRCEDGEVRVDVKDTGIGIPPQDMPRIFERFYRVDKARSRELGGTGLGLAIVKHIVQGLNGRVWVESIPSRGSTFSFTLKPAR